MKPYKLLVISKTHFLSKIFLFYFILTLFYTICQGHLDSHDQREVQYHSEHFEQMPQGSRNAPVDQDHAQSCQQIQEAVCAVRCGARQSDHGRSLVQ